MNKKKLDLKIHSVTVLDDQATSYLKGGDASAKCTNLSDCDSCFCSGEIACITKEAALAGG